MFVGKKTAAISLSLNVAIFGAINFANAHGADGGSISQATPNSQMKAVLDSLATLGGKPIETLSAEEARKQPTPADAVKALLAKKGKSTQPPQVGKVDDRKLNVEQAEEQLGAQAKKLRDLALKDELTGLHNRRGFLLLPEQQLRHAARSRRPALVELTRFGGHPRSVKWA